MHAHRRVGGVDALAARPRGDEHVDAQVGVVDFGHVLVVQHRDGVDGRERCVPPLGLVVGRHPDEPVGAGLGRHQPVGPRPLDGHGDRLDTGLVTLLVVADRDLEPAPLGPADQHAPEHLGPVLRLGPPAPG